MAGDICEYRCFAPLAFGKWMSSCRDGMMASHNISVSFSKGLTNQASQNSMTSKNLLKVKLFRPESTFFMDKKKKGVFGSRSTSVSFDHWNVHFLRYFCRIKHKDTIENKESMISHFSKSQIFVQNSNIFTSFSPNFFDNFSREIKVVNGQKVQNHYIFTSFSPKKNRQFSREIKVEFLDKKWRFLTVW